MLRNKMVTELTNSVFLLFTKILFASATSTNTVICIPQHCHCFHEMLNVLLFLAQIQLLLQPRYKMKQGTHFPVDKSIVVFIELKFYLHLKRHFSNIQDFYIYTLFKVINSNNIYYSSEDLNTRIMQSIFSQVNLKARYISR